MSPFIIDARYSLMTVVLAGFGRAVSEVGAVIIVGGNIDHLTRVLTTAIALETSKGELELALAAGFCFCKASLAVNFFWHNGSKRLPKGGPMSDRATPAVNCLLPVTIDNLSLAFERARCD